MLLAVFARTRSGTTCCRKRTFCIILESAQDVFLHYLLQLSFTYPQVDWQSCFLSVHALLKLSNSDAYFCMRKIAFNSDAFRQSAGGLSLTLLMISQSLRMVAITFTGSLLIFGNSFLIGRFGTHSEGEASF